MSRTDSVVDIVIYHNPDCGTSRNALAMILNAGIEPHVIEYLKTPPSRALLLQLVERAGLTPRQLLRDKGTPYAELGLADESLGDDALVDAMIAHPILINRPLVVSPLGVRLCRPSETVLDLLPVPQQGAFAKEDGEPLLDRTMVLYGSNLGDANAHSTTNLPTLFAGGGFRHGQHLAFDRARNYPLPNLYVSVLQRLGIEAASFGPSTGTMRGLEVA